MIVNLMLSRDEPETLVKQPTSIIEMTGTLRTECSVLDPVILIQIDQERVNITRINYCYIPEFNRYYFIKGMRVMRENLWEIALHVDVLMSYKDFIKELPAVVSRNENSGNMLEDPKVVSYADSLVSTVKFPNSLPAPTYILAAIGKGGDNQ